MSLHFTPCDLNVDRGGIVYGIVILHVSENDPSSVFTMITALPLATPVTTPPSTCAFELLLDDQIKVLLLTFVGVMLQSGFW